MISTPDFGIALYSLQKLSYMVFYLIFTNLREVRPENYLNYIDDETVSEGLGDLSKVIKLRSS